MEPTIVSAIRFIETAITEFEVLSIEAATNESPVVAKQWRELADEGIKVLDDHENYLKYRI